MRDEEFKVTDKRGQPSQDHIEEEAGQKQHAEIGFASLIVSLGTSAMIHMGVIENPVTKQKEKDISAAKQEIDLIMMLKNKTQGNLNDAEKKVLDQVLAELQMRFVEASK
ncbi:MAG: DUF1844 domain-containing protein [Bdellovibrionota bacterium]